MRSHGGLKRWPISMRQRAAMRAAVRQVEQVLAHGVTPEQLAQAQADLDAMNRPRQPSLPLKVRA